VRIGLGLYTVAMAFALVYGGEHFVADILAGWAMAAAAFTVVQARPWARLRPGRSSGPGPAHAQPRGLGST